MRCSGHLRRSLYAVTLRKHTLCELHMCTRHLSHSFQVDSPITGLKFT